MFVCYVEERLTGAIIRVGDDPERNNTFCGQITSEQVEAKQNITVSCDLSPRGQYVSIELPGMERLSLCEVKIFETECIRK